MSMPWHLIQRYQLCLSSVLTSELQSSNTHAMSTCPYHNTTSNRMKLFLSLKLMPEPQSIRNCAMSVLLLAQANFSSVSCFLFQASRLALDSSSSSIMSQYQDCTAVCSGPQPLSLVMFTFMSELRRIFAILSDDIVIKDCPSCDTLWSGALLRWSQKLESVSFLRRSDVTFKCYLTKVAYNAVVYELPLLLMFGEWAIIRCSARPAKPHKGIIKWHCLRLHWMHHGHAFHPIMIDVI